MDSANFVSRTCRPFLDPDAVVELLGISRRHLDAVRRDDPSFPEPRMVGSLPRWTYESLRDWVAEPSKTLREGEPSAGDLAAAEPDVTRRRRGTARVH